MSSEKICSVISNKEIADGIFMIKLFVSQNLKFSAGQFVNVKINRHDLLLRRPISIHRYEDTEISLIYKVVGKGTKELSLQNKGDFLSILAPLGNGFDVKEEYENIWLLGGGIGCAPLMSVIDKNKDKKFTTFLGFDNENSIYCKDEFDEKSEELFISTDDGSFGHHGFVTDLVKQQLEESKPDVVFACGPTPMFKSIKSVLSGTGIKAYFSVEERMGCGMGGCAVCACKTTDGVKKACVDGPVFDMDKVVL